MLLLLTVLTPAGAQEESEAPLPPFGRPIDLPFSGASGMFQARARAEPTTVEAEQPLTLILTVQATGPVQRAPHRIDLSEVPEFTDRFHLVESEPEEQDAAVPDPEKRTWEFRYILKPRDTSVTVIPGIPFVFYNPFIQARHLRYQTLYTSEIPLRVTEPEVLAVPLEAPESAFQLRTGPGLLAREEPWRLPSGGVLLACLLIPPLAAGLWYLGWRRLHPDEAWRLQQHRSRAARRALDRLHGGRRLAGTEQIDHVARVLADYLRERFAFPAAEPTPVEIAAHLARHNLTAALVDRASGFVRTCDRLRFAPGPEVSEANLAHQASQLIVALEEETWPVPSS
jgi:hypothetical protein